MHHSTEAVDDATLIWPEEHLRECIAGRCNAFEVLMIEPEASTLRLRPKGVPAALIEQQAATLLVTHSGSTSMCRVVKEAKSTLTGNGGIHPSPYVKAGANSPETMTIYKSQKEYIKACKAAAVGSSAGGGLPPWDERNGWKDLGMMTDLLDSLDKTIRKQCPLNPIQIVLAGDENSGKSQLAQRIVGRELFAIKDGFCTKVPTKIIFRRRKHLHSAVLRFVEHNSDGREVHPKAGSVSQIKDGPVPIERSPQFYYGLQQKIDSIAAHYGGGDQFPLDGEFVIELCAPDVPNLFLIDLPGLVSMPEGFRRQTTAVTRMYFEQENSIIISVWSAAQETLRATRLARVLSDVIATTPTLTSRHIAVLVKADDASSRGGDSDKKRRLLDRLRGTHSDWTAGIGRFFSAGSNIWIPFVSKGPHHPYVSPKLDLDHEDCKLREAGLRDTEQDAASPVPKYGLRAFHHQLNDCINRHILMRWRPRYVATIDRYAQSLTNFLDSSIGTPVAEVTPQMVHREMCKRFVQNTSGEYMAPLTRSACSPSGVFTKCSELWEKSKAALADTARMPESPPGSAAFQVKVAEECIELSESLTQVLISSVPIYLRTLAKTIAMRVTGIPLSEEVLSNPSRGIPPEAYPKASPLNLWRFDKERTAFEMALAKKLNESASTVTAMAMTITAELIGPRSSFEQHLESIILQVLIRSAATIGPTGHAPGWYRLDRGRLPKESVMVAHYRARLIEDLDSIDRGRTLVGEVLPGIALDESVAEATPRIEFYFSKGDSVSDASSSYQGSAYGGSQYDDTGNNLQDMLGTVSPAGTGLGHHGQQISPLQRRQYQHQQEQRQQQQQHQQRQQYQQRSPISNGGGGGAARAYAGGGAMRPNVNVMGSNVNMMGPNINMMSSNVNMMMSNVDMAGNRTQKHKRNTTNPFDPTSTPV